MDFIQNENINFLRGFSFFKTIGNLKLLGMIYDIEIIKIKTK